MKKINKDSMLKMLQASILDGSVKCRRYDGSYFDFGTESGYLGIYIYDKDDQEEFFMAEDLDLNRFEVEIL